MIILTADDVTQLNTADGVYGEDGTYQGVVTALVPRLILDGTSALPEAVLSDPAHQRWWTFLSPLPTRIVGDNEWA